MHDMNLQTAMLYSWLHQSLGKALSLFLVRVCVYNIYKIESTFLKNNKTKTAGAMTPRTKKKNTATSFVRSGEGCLCSSRRCLGDGPAWPRQEKMDYEFKALRGTRTKCLLVLAIPQPIPVPS